MNLNSFRKKIVYAARHYGPTWRYLFNLRSVLEYQREREPLPDESIEIIRRLNKDGLAITSVDHLPGVSPYFAELSRAVDKLELELGESIDAARSKSDVADLGRKTFILQLLGEHPKLDPDSIFARLALSGPVLQIANEYFGMYTQVRYYNVWHTLTTTADPRESQLWHFDREDYLILKLFVYLSDVDDGAGPLTYAAGTHRKGKIRRQPEYFTEEGVRRWMDDQMEKVVPSSKWIKATGQKGTFVFADTRGFHKGGLARDKDRLVYVCLFTSPTSQAPELFVRPNVIPEIKDKAQSLALALPARGVFA